MKGTRVGFVYKEKWKIGTVQCISVDFPGYYAIFLVKMSDGEIIPVSSRDIAYI